ncbi:hypothetical protein H5S09_09820 [Limosilactobacillus sp. STM2_1]|uniref:Uncharacterized protein n=1 Tax=Limosilactobacillus rudii TaxID=2759755 RepID=A0A7W3UMC9_9LACO|nr:hypothetical protein [Limosilactobacillus rudii]MBB1078893.1 hypothetical protein [Limosilactobacillus rudii]MBB1098231.1 hypothetical protein [Limosilactobacillus rudii]MCD7135654.1 hypothetical protein [Limosilactobacillus rudii]
MATNLSRDDELREILSDIARKRFVNSRQINPASNLFITVKHAVNQHYIDGAILDETFSSSLAEMDLKNATLTESGQQKLTELINTQGKE